MKKFLLVCVMLQLLCVIFLCSAALLEYGQPPQTVTAEAPLPEQPWETTPGMAVMADGHLLPGGSVIIDGTPYVRLCELTEALQAEVRSQGVFRWQRTTVTLRPDSRQVAFLEKNTSDFLAAPVIAVGQTFFVPVELCEMLGMGLLEDPVQQLLYITPGAGDYAIPHGYAVPTLMYHAVGDDLWGFPELFVSPAEMEAQLRYLNENGYTTIHFSDLRVIDQIEKPVLLTFDDGYLDNYTELFPLLQKYNCKATIHVITDMIDTHPRYMTWAQAREMADSGLVSIQSHTVTHPNLDELTMEEQARELSVSYEDILTHLGREPYVLCYPTGRQNDTTLQLLGNHYRFGLKMSGSTYVTGQDPGLVGRWYVPRGLHLGTFGDMVRR